MSVPKSFEQVLADWRMHAENRYAAEATRHEWTASRKATLKSCADEAQPILDKLREEVEKMPCECNPRVGYECYKHPLERILGNKV